MKKREIRILDNFLAISCWLLPMAVPLNLVGTNLTFGGFIINNKKEFQADNLEFQVLDIAKDALPAPPFAWQ